eukprot:jgi/Hompol1/6223/HPOL_001334-RA
MLLEGADPRKLKLILTRVLPRILPAIHSPDGYIRYFGECGLSAKDTTLLGKSLIHKNKSTNTLIAITQAVAQEADHPLSVNADDLRYVCVTNRELIVTSPGGSGIEMMIPLIQIIGISHYARQHEARFMGGLPHMLIRYDMSICCCQDTFKGVVKLGKDTLKDQDDGKVQQIELRTARPFWNLWRSLYRAVVDCISVYAARDRIQIPQPLASSCSMELCQFDELRSKLIQNGLSECIADISELGSWYDKMILNGSYLVSLAALGRTSKRARDAFWNV